MNTATKQAPKVSITTPPIFGDERSQRRHDDEIEDFKARQDVPRAVMPGCTITIDDRVLRAGDEVTDADLAKIREAGVEFYSLDVISVLSRDEQRLRVIDPSKHTHRVKRAFTGGRHDGIFVPGQPVGPADFERAEEPATEARVDELLINPPLGADLGSSWRLPDGFQLVARRNVPASPGREAVRGADEIKRLEAMGFLEPIPKDDMARAKARQKAGAR